VSRPSGRLLLRVYSVIMLQVVAIAGCIALVGWLTFKPEPRGL
jgi:hypothetical protein